MRIGLTVLLAGCGAPTGPELDLCDQPGAICVIAGVPGLRRWGDEGVRADRSPLLLPVDSTVGPDGRLYVVDYGNHRIRRVEPDGTIHTVTGTGMLGDGVVNDRGEGEPGPALDFAWDHPTDVAFQPGIDELLWVAGWHTSRIDRLDLRAEWVDHVWGTGSRDFAGDGGPAADAAFDLPVSVVWDDLGNAWISGQGNQVIRRVDADGVIETIAGAPGELGYSGDGGPAAEAMFRSDVGGNFDPSNKIEVAGRCLFVADTRNQVIRLLGLDALTIERFAGRYEWNGEEDLLRDGGVIGFAGDGGDALDAAFANPRDVAVGPEGEVYVADTDNHCVRVVTPDGIVHTFAGTCTVPGDDAHRVPATRAHLHAPYGVEVDGEGNVYVADMYNHVIRRVRAGGLPDWDPAATPRCLPDALPPPGPAPRPPDGPPLPWER